MASEPNPYDSATGCPTVQTPESNSQRRLLFGILVGIAANAMVLLACLELLRCEPGGVVKPLFGNSYPVLAVALGLAIGLPLSITGIRRTHGPLRWIGLVGIVLALMPLPLCNSLVHWFATMRGLMLEN
jgi:hypothetical protein